MNTSTALSKKKNAQINLFQANTFEPSSISIGSKLKNAKKKFTLPASAKTICKKSPLNKLAIIINNNPTTKLITGPASEIIPFCLGVTFSAKK